MRFNHRRGQLISRNGGGRPSKPIVNNSPEKNFEPTQLSLEGFRESVRQGRPLPGMTEHGQLNAAIAIILGQQAMETGQVVSFEKELAI